MVKDWIDFKSIYGNLPGAREGFENACASLFRALFPTQNEVHHVQVNKGDEGIDILIGNLDTDLVTVAQCKYFISKLDQSQKQQISNSFNRVATNTKYRLGNWILCIPIQLNFDEIKWWQGWKKVQSSKYNISEDNISIYDGDSLIDNFKKTNLYDRVFNIENSLIIKKCSDSIESVLSLMNIDSNYKRLLIESKTRLEDIILNHKLFVKHEGYEDALSYLEKYNACLISGIPGFGKTTTAGELCLYYINLGYSFYYIHDSVSEVISVIEKDEAQVFFYDDFLGMISLNRNIPDSEINRIKDILGILSRNKNKKIVFTTREYILNQASLEYDIINRSLAGLKKYIIDFSDYTINEKAKILYRHMVYSNLSKEILHSFVKNNDYSIIIEHNNYSPRIVAFMTSDGYISSYLKYSDYISNFKYNLDNPVEIWKTAFSKISQTSQILLFLLIFENGRCSKDELFNDYLCIVQEENCSVSINEQLNESLVEMKDSLISILNMKSSTEIQFSNPSVFDFLMYYLNENTLVIDRFFFVYKIFIGLFSFLTIAFEQDQEYLQFTFKYPKIVQHLRQYSKKYNDYLLSIISEPLFFINKKNKSYFNASVILGLKYIFSHFLDKELYVNNFTVLYQSYLSTLDNLNKGVIIEGLKLKTSGVHLENIITSDKIIVIDGLFLSINSIDDLDYLKKYQKYFIDYSGLSKSIISLQYIKIRDTLQNEINNCNSISRLNEYYSVIEEFGQSYSINISSELRKIDSKEIDLNDAVDHNETILDEEHTDDDDYYDEYDFDADKIKSMFMKLVSDT